MPARPSSGSCRSRCSRWRSTVGTIFCLFWCHSSSYCSSWSSTSGWHRWWRRAGWGLRLSRGGWRIGPGWTRSFWGWRRRGRPGSQRGSYWPGLCWWPRRRGCRWWRWWLWLRAPGRSAPGPGWPEGQAVWFLTISLISYKGCFRDQSRVPSDFIGIIAITMLQRLFYC